LEFTTTSKEETKMNTTTVSEGTLPNDWRTKVLATAPALLARHQYVTGEDIRLFCDQHGCGAPPHPNAWGSVSLSLRTLGMIEEADQAPRKAKDPRSRGTRQLVWKSKLFTGTADQLKLPL
jgi:hypothetical protein